MKAVYSLFNTTGNFLKDAKNWSSPRFLLYSWLISIKHAKAQFGNVELITDTHSAKIIEKLNLPFTNIRTDLDSIMNYDKSLWALGKVKAYQLQKEPFIHIDNDVILFGKLDNNFLTSEIGFQSLEDGDIYKKIYNKDVTILMENGKNLPLNFNILKEAYNFGIYLCNNLDYNEKYCKTSFEFIDNNYEIAKSIIKSTQWFNIIFEQYIGACVANEMGIEPKYISRYLDINEINKKQYVHIWGSKHESEWFNLIKKIAERDYPNEVDLINKIINDNL